MSEPREATFNETENRPRPAFLLLRIDMVYKVGRFLQMVGMVILPVAIAGNATDTLTLGQMLTWTAVGVIVFAAGWMLQQQGKP